MEEWQPDRRRLSTVLSGGIPDRVPYFEIHVDRGHVQHVLGRPVTADYMDLPVEDYAEFIRKTGIDFFYYNHLWKIGRVYRPDSDGKMHYVDGSIKTPSDLSTVSPPDITRSRTRVVELARAAKEQGAGFILGVSTPYKLAKAAVGYHDFLLKTVDDPAFLEGLIEILGRYERQSLQSLLECRPDAVLIPGDLCINTGPMLSPESIKKLWLTSTLEFIKPIKDSGIPLILHMDGDFSSIVDITMAVEPDAIHPFEPCGNIDIYQAKTEYGGRVTLIGNIDLGRVLSFGKPQEVRASVQEHIERLAPGGRYMCGSSHEISEAVPVENFEALYRSVNEFGAYR